ncbi:MAG: hypothetical protein NUV58_04970 [Candidatus Roizmanbacteria bacterium]|nr:hypothetical protein [Candidatus Roizmanbacteria bacterium]
MKILKLEVDDSVFDRFKAFLEILPKSKIKIKEIYDNSHIDFVEKKEQRNIEKTLSDENCHIVSHSKLVKL